MTAIGATSAGFLGLVVGSFLNVVIHRVPRGGSLVRPPSSCPRCGAKILARDNIPVVSFVLRRGRCRACGDPIPARYPMVEAVNALVWIGAVLRFDVGEEAALVALSGSVLLALSLIDLEHRRLPNAIVGPAIAAAAVWLALASAVRGDWSIFTWGLICGAAAFTLLFLIAFISGGMGFGDVKLAAFIGLVTGRFDWEVTVGAIFAAFIGGGLVSVGLILSRKKGRKESIPFGPALAAGAMIGLFAGPGPVRAWLGV